MHAAWDTDPDGTGAVERFDSGYCWDQADWLSIIAAKVIGVEKACGALAAR
jgi:hypothetical protein